MSTITVQFEGICCHIAPPLGSPATAKRRAVLPDVHEHIPYLEVYANDVDVAANPDFSFSDKYPRGEAYYRRVELHDVKVELLDVTTTTFETLSSFFQRVPSLTAVEPRFTQMRSALLQPTVPAGQIAAYFDINVGVLSSGPPEHFRTVFEPPRNWPVRHLGQWVSLDLEVSVSAPRVRVTDLGAAGTVRVLVLKDGADLITIGNQTEDDLLGNPSTVGHFAHYYDLSPVALPNAPIPSKSQGLGVGCADTHWP
ncbi:MAG: hypothetical protein ACJ74H_14585 [Thermoanaerobaculia bacterium]